MIIGLTGGIGSGKSTVADILRKKGLLVVDCDKIGHQILERGGAAEKEVLAAFGDSILEDGVISRKKLGSIVFQDAEKRACLNRITHKHIKDEVEKRIAGEKNAVIDGALLYESGISDLCDQMIVVTCPEEIRVQRIMKRDGISHKDAVQRMLSQESENVLTNRANVVIINNGSVEELQEKTEAIFQSWCIH